MNVVRWSFQDMETNDVYVVELNPNTMSGFTFSRSFRWARSGTRAAGLMDNRQPGNFQFGGVVRSESHHDALIEWQKRGGKVRITDHLGRVFEVMIKSLAMTDRRPAGSDTWRFQYQFDCLFLRRTA